MKAFITIFHKGHQYDGTLSHLFKAFEKVNKMLDDATQVTRGISRSVTSMSGLVEGIKTGLSVVKLFGKKEEVEDV